MNLEAVGVFLPPGAEQPAELAADGEAGAAVFQLLPPRSSMGRLASALAHLRRRATLRMRGFGADVVHLPPPRVGDDRGVRRVLREALLGGLVVSPREVRVLDLIVREALGDRRLSYRDPHVTPAGSIVVSVDTPAVVLRIGLAGGASDPSRHHAAIRRCVELGVALAPTPLGAGHFARYAWTLESRLPGERPRRLTDGLVSEVLTWCEGLPRHDQAGDPVASMVQFLPSEADRLGRIALAVRSALVALPGGLIHGDLWRGNLLVGDGLSGVVDWDAMSEGGLAGVDAMHLLGERMGREKGRSFGEIAALSGWESPDVRPHLDRHLRRLGAETGADIRAAVGLAWWATVSANSLRRNPALCGDPGWMTRNVGGVLDVWSGTR